MILWLKGGGTYIGRGAILPQCLNTFFPHCSSNFSAEFFSFVKESHLQKHLSCAESDVLIEVKKCSNVQVVNFYKKVQLPVIKFVCLISTGNFLQFLLPQQKNNSNLQIYSSIIHVQNVYFFASKNVQLNVNIHVLTVELE